MVDDHECASLLNRNSSLVLINVALELCAGKKNYIPNYPVYARIKKGKKVWKLSYNNSNVTTSITLYHDVR